MNRIEPNLLFPMLEDLRKAAHSHRQVSVIYQGAADGKATKRTIDPYALVFRAGLWYLVGYCHLRRAPRTFRVDRIQQITVLDQTFLVPEDFDVHQHLEREFKDQPSIRARLHFIPEAAHIVTGSRHLWESIEENPDGSSVVTLTSPDLPFLASMTLSFAHWVRVLEPPELRAMVRGWAQATVDQYST